MTKNEQLQNLRKAWSLLASVECFPVKSLNEISKLCGKMEFEAEPEWEDEKRLQFWENYLDYLHDKGCYHKTWTAKPYQMIRELKEKIAAKG